MCDYLKCVTVKITFGHILKQSCRKFVSCVHFGVRVSDVPGVSLKQASSAPFENKWRFSKMTTMFGIHTRVQPPLLGLQIRSGSVICSEVYFELRGDSRLLCGVVPFLFIPVPRCGHRLWQKKNWNYSWLLELFGLSKTPNNLLFIMAFKTKIVVCCAGGSKADYNVTSDSLSHFFVGKVVYSITCQKYRRHGTKFWIDNLHTYQSSEAASCRMMLNCFA